MNLAPQWAFSLTNLVMSLWTHHTIFINDIQTERKFHVYLISFRQLTFNVWVWMPQNNSVSNIHFNVRVHLILEEKLRYPILSETLCGKYVR